MITNTINHSYDYKQNWTLLIPVTIINMLPFMLLDVLDQSSIPMTW